jgi:hypothetical protein
MAYKSSVISPSKCSQIELVDINLKDLHTRCFCFSHHNHTMGNSESVIVSRHERYHGSGRRGDVRIVPRDDEYRHHKRRRYHASTNSETSSRRPKRRIRFEEPESSSESDFPRPTRVRSANQYSREPHRPTSYVVDQGYVIPGMYSNATPRIKPQEFIEGRSSGHAYTARPKPAHNLSNSAGSYVPQQRLPPPVVRRYPENSPSYVRQWSRRT